MATRQQAAGATAGSGAPALLAFDTATEDLALAAAQADTAGGRTLTRNAPGGAAASATLLPQLAALRAELGLAMAEVGAIAYGCGPGAFTGLRTACAAAQGLALGLGCRLWPVDSLLIVAEDARAVLAPEAEADFEVAVAMDARMDEAYAARYRWSAGAWQVLAPPVLVAPQALAAQWRAAQPPAVAGSALGAFGGRLGLPAATPCVALQQDRAGALLRLARAAVAAGPGLDPADALPMYLRDKVALTTAERAAAAAERRAATGAAP